MMNDERGIMVDFCPSDKNLPKFIIPGSPKTLCVFGVGCSFLISHFIASAISSAVRPASALSPVAIFFTVTIPLSASFPPITAV